MTNRVVLGQFADGGFGLRVSESGYNVLSNPVDKSRLAFSSDWEEAMPIHVADQLVVNAGETKTATYPSLGYIPFGAYLWRSPARTGWTTTQWRPSGDQGRIQVRWNATTLTAVNPTAGTYDAFDTVVAFVIFRKPAGF